MKTADCLYRLIYKMGIDSDCLNDNSILFSFNGNRMRVTADMFTCSAEINETVFACEYCDKDNDSQCPGAELTNALNVHLHPYRFVWNRKCKTINVCKVFGFTLDYSSELILRVEILRMSRLCEKIVKICRMWNCGGSAIAELQIQSLANDIDKCVAGELLELNILYLHGFASSGNSGTAKEIQACLPKCRVFCPDLPIEPGDALRMIREIRSKESIDMVIGTSMGGLLTLFSDVGKIIMVNPSLHVSKMMQRRLGGAERVVIPYFKAREDGSAEFTLTAKIAESYRNLESNAFKQSRLSIMTNILGIFGTDDDVVDCKDEFLEHFSDIRYFNGGHRLNQTAVVEVVVPAILQMVINAGMWTRRRLLI